MYLKIVPTPVIHKIDGDHPESSPQAAVQKTHSHSQYLQTLRDSRINSALLFKANNLPTEQRKPIVAGH